MGHEGAPDVHCELFSGTSCFCAHVLGPAGGTKPCGMALAGKALSSRKGHLEAPEDVEGSHLCLSLESHFGLGTQAAATQVMQDDKRVKTCATEGV